MNREQREILTDTLERIKSDQKHWNQRQWGSLSNIKDIDSMPMPTPCNTAYCFAGHVAIKTGYPDLTTYILSYLSYNNIDLEAWTWDDYDKATHCWAEGLDVNGSKYRPAVEKFARQKLGITNDAAYRLFSEYNNLEDLERIVNNILLNDGDYLDDETNSTE